MVTMFFSAYIVAIFCLCLEIYYIFYNRDKILSGLFLSSKEKKDLTTNNSLTILKLAGEDYHRAVFNFVLLTNLLNIFAFILFYIISGESDIRWFFMPKILTLITYFIGLLQFGRKGICDYIEAALNESIFLTCWKFISVSIPTATGLILLLVS